MALKSGASREKIESPALSYTITVRFLSVILNLYYRRIETWGAENIPKQGPTIFVAAPHCNQLVDPIILAHTILQAGDIPVSNLIPNFWAKKTFIGLIAKYLGSITLDRASDFQIPGTGTITLPDPVIQPLVIRGIGTKFVEEAQIGGLVLLPTLDQRTSFATIESIHGPEEIHLKRPFSHPQNALLQLSANCGENSNAPGQIYGSSYKLAPKLDRAKLFESLSREFGNNRRLLIFPEGASHDRPTLIPLQGGVANMALGELAAKPGSQISVVPCGLNYSQGATFRSRVLVEFGQPVKISPELVKRYRSGKESEAVQELLEDINRSLLAVTFSTPNNDIRSVVQLMTQLYAANTRNKGGLAARAKINRNILKRYTQQKDQDHVIVLAGELIRYKQRLTVLHIRDRDVNTNEESLLITCTKIAFKLCFLFLLVIPTLPGLVLFLPVFLVAHKYANKKAVFLTSISSFRVTGRDTIATWRLLASLAVAPPLYGLYTMAAVSGVCLYHQALHAFTTSPILIMIFSLFVFVGLWMVTVISLFTGDLLMDTLSSLRRHILSISPSAIALKSLREQRTRLKSKVVEFVNGTGPFAS